MAIVPVFTNFVGEGLSYLLTQSTNYVNSWGALIVEAGHVHFVLLRKGLSQQQSFNEVAYRRPFSTLRCWIDLRQFEAPPVNSSGSLDTVALVSYPIQSPDRGSPQDLWARNLYVVNGFAIRLLHNEFHPSAELPEGFDYHLGTLVVRGHAQHVAGEERALDEVRDQFDQLLKRMAIPSLQIETKTKNQLNTAQQKLESMSKILNRPMLIPNAFEKDVNKQLEALFTHARRISQLRLYQSNSDTSKEIKERQQKIKDGLNPLNSRVQQEYFASAIKPEEVDALEEGMETYQKMVADLRTMATESKARENATLTATWDQCVRQLNEVTIENRVNAAQGPIVRIYQTSPIQSLPQLKRACWHILAQLIQIDSSQEPSQKTYLADAQYRVRLLELFKEERQFYFTLQSQNFFTRKEVLQSSEKHLKELDTLHQHWLDFNRIMKSINLTHMNLVLSDFIWKFSEILGMGLNNLHYDFLFPGDSQPIFEKNIDAVLNLLIKRMRLNDYKLSLMQKLQVSSDSLHFLNSDYSPKRARLDEQFFQLITSALLTEQSGTPDAAMLTFGQLATEFLSTTRYYGALKTTISLATSPRALSAFLDYPLRFIDHAIAYLGTLGTSHEQITESLKKASDELALFGTELDSIVERVDDQLKTKNKDFNWWNNFQGFRLELYNPIDRIKNLVDRVANQLLDQFPFQPLGFETNFFHMKGELISSLKRLNSLEPQRSPIAKEIMTFLQVLEKGQVSSNRGLEDAKKEVEKLKELLSKLKGTTSYDRQVRDETLERLEQVEATLVQDPVNELFMRATALKNAIEQKQVSIPQVEEKIKTEIEKIPNEQAFKIPILLLFQSTPLQRSQLLNQLNALPKDLKADPSLKELRKASEHEHILALLTDILRDISLHNCFQEKRKLEECAQYLKLNLVQRDWATDQNNIETYYTWCGSPIKQDPNYSTSTTHIRI